MADGEDHVAHVLFSALPDDVGLYGKPMARNAQIWTHGFRLLLDGPRADRKAILRAAAALEEGGQFGYRFIYPAMRVGRYEVYWHRPLVAFLSPKTGRARSPPRRPAGLPDRLPCRPAGPGPGGRVVAAAAGPRAARGGGPGLLPCGRRETATSIG